jgi:hypothetical protein
MKSSLLKSALVAVVGLALCAPVALQAQTNAVNPIATSPVVNPQASTSSTKAKKTPYKGTVKSIDASSLVVTTAKGDLTLAIAPTTKVLVNKKAAAVTDITVGETVTGSYTKDDTGALTAASIHTKTK